MARENGYTDQQLQRMLDSAITTGDHLLKAKAHAAKRELDASDEAYRKVLQHARPETIAALQGLGSNALDRRDYNTALTHFQAAAILVDKDQSPSEWVEAQHNVLSAYYPMKDERGVALAADIVSMAGTHLANDKPVLAKPATVVLKTSAKTTTRPGNSTSAPSTDPKRQQPGNYAIPD